MKELDRFAINRYCELCLEKVEYINNPSEIEKKFGQTYYCNPCDEYLTIKQTLNETEMLAKREVRR